MSIVIRELVINATVDHQADGVAEADGSAFDPEAYKIELLDACRELVRQVHRLEKER